MVPEGGPPHAATTPNARAVTSAIPGVEPILYAVLRLIVSRAPTGRPGSGRGPAVPAGAGGGRRLGRRLRAAQRRPGAQPAGAVLPAVLPPYYVHVMATPLDAAAFLLTRALSGLGEQKRESQMGNVHGSPTSHLFPV